MGGGRGGAGDRATALHPHHVRRGDGGGGAHAGPRQRRPRLVRDRRGAADGGRRLRLLLQARSGRRDLSGSVQPPELSLAPHDGGRRPGTRRLLRGLLRAGAGPRRAAPPARGERRRARAGDAGEEPHLQQRRLRFLGAARPARRRQPRGPARPAEPEPGGHPRQERAPGATPRPVPARAPPGHPPRIGGARGARGGSATGPRAGGGRRRRASGRRGRRGREGWWGRRRGAPRGAR
mmetsp:Transcript_3222/g.9318  ORF Transcript_3222/g.9318 Transcript_3222/m.9318 type:complete len:236 (+) Transcript_3222:270-977(+)